MWNDFQYLKISFIIFQHPLSKYISSLTHPVNWGLFQQNRFKYYNVLSQKKEITYFPFEVFGVWKKQGLDHSQWILGGA